jgi:hypothetical protein
MTIALAITMGIGLLVAVEVLIAKTTPAHVKAFMEDWRKGEAMGRGWTNFYRTFDQGNSEFSTEDADWILEFDAPTKRKGLLVLKTAETWKGDLLKGGRR